MSEKVFEIAWLMCSTGYICLVGLATWKMAKKEKGGKLVCANCFYL